jgi:diguanylate cyclase (GGDEF)-like protein
MTLDQTPRLVLIEDDPDTTALIEETLVDHFGPGCVRSCATVAEASDVDVREVDLVISDMNLPDGTGLELLERYLAERPDLPMIFVTAEGVLENAIRAIRLGAYDYVVKIGDYLFSIPLIVEKNLAIWQTKRENQQLHEQLACALEQMQVKNKQLQEAVAQLETVAATDPLTGLANRRAFGVALGRAFADAHRNHNDLTCIMLDLDGFKHFNDTFGHQAGDDLLKCIADLLQHHCRQSDVAGRFGGDEFIILLPHADEQTARQVALRMQEGLDAELARINGPDNIKAAVTMSMGLACLNHRTTRDPEQLIAHADHALYRAKQAGKNRMVIYRAASGEHADRSVDLHQPGSGSRMAI